MHLDGNMSMIVQDECICQSQHKALSTSPVLQVVQPINGDPFIGMLEVGVRPTILCPRLPMCLSTLLAGLGPGHACLLGMQTAWPY